MKRQLRLVIGATLALLCSSPRSRAFAPAAAGGEKRFLIAVGVNEYPSLDLEASLYGASKDVENLARVLKDKFKFAWSSQRLNGAATQKAILQTLETVEKLAQPGDQVVFYFSGCGSTQEDGQPTLCPYDAQRDSPARDISVQTLGKWMNRLESKRVFAVAILDCGFPALTKGFRVRSRAYKRPNADWIPSPAPGQPDAIEQMMARMGAPLKGVLVTASKPTQPVSEYNLARGQWEGIFTHFLVEALQAYNFGESKSWVDFIGDPAFTGTGRGWAKAVAPMVMRFTYANDRKTQTPSVYGKGERAVFSATRAPTPVVSSSSEELAVRLRVQVFYEEPAAAERWADLEEKIKAEMQALAFVRLVAAEEAADRTLVVWNTKEQANVYLTDASRAVVKRWSVARREEWGAWVKALREELGNFYWFRWLTTLPSINSRVSLIFQTADEDGKRRVEFQVNEEITLQLRSERSDVFVTVLWMDPSGKIEKVFPEEGGRNHLPKGKPPRGDKEFYEISINPLPPLSPGRYVAIAVASEKNLPYQQVLREFLEQRAGRAAERPTPLPVLFGEERGHPGGRGERRPPSPTAAAPLDRVVALAPFSIEE